MSRKEKERIENSIKDIVFKDFTQTDNVDINTEETVTVKPPTGEIWRVLHWYFNVSADADATSGTHNVQPQMGPDYFRLLLGKSNYNTDICWKWNVWDSADVAQQPSNEAAAVLALQNTYITHDRPLKVLYWNGTDVVQENDRTIRFLMMILAKG